MRFRASAAALLFIFALGIKIKPVEAHWFTSILREAGEAGGKVARHADPHLGPLGKAAGHLGHLPEGSKGALAAHVTPEGHWKFVNKEGEVFTAAHADEMAHLKSSLATDAAGESKLSLYLTEDSAFANRQYLEKLPKEADLHLVTDYGAFPIVRSDEALKVRFKPNVSIELTEKGLLDETLSFLSRPLKKADVRTIALEPGASKTLSAAPIIDPSTKAALVDKLDPADLDRAFGSIRGQTAVVVGRIENGKVFFKPQSGSEFSRNVDEVLNVARQNDVNLVLLNAGYPMQPGGKNWLWQNIEVEGYNDAIAQKTFGDFVDALAARRAPMMISASEAGAGRVHIRAVPAEGGLMQPATSVFEEFLGHVTGEIAQQAIEIDVRDTGSQQELDGRFIPGIPTYIQIPYFVGIVMGILGWPVSRSWWRRIWPPMARAEGRSRFGNLLKNFPNFAAYLLLFLPVVGGPALLWQAMLQAWATVTAPLRWIARMFRRKVQV